MATTLGSYSETNYATTTPLRAGTNYLMGNTFLCPINANPTTAKFYLSTTGVPDGFVYAYIYATVGTFGLNENTTGSPLATSDPFPIESILPAISLVEFTFSGVNKIDLDLGTAYSVICGYNGGDASNRLNFGYDSSAPTNAGIMSYSSNGTTWTRGSTLDACFYIYGDEILVPDATKINNIETTGYINLWESDLPWTVSSPWYYPTFTRINNIENS